MISLEEKLELQSTYKALNIREDFWDEISDAQSEPRTELFEYIENITMLQWLVKPPEERGYAKDKPRDKKGRIIVDIVKPHMLEDMDYFRPAALHFEKYGVYTKAYPNPHPKSEFMRYWMEERRRCKEGYVRESDGEWISGYNYWYWNYSQIKVTQELEEGGTRSDRVDHFPSIWDSDYLFFHYVEQGEENSKYGAVLKSRGKGYSFKVASMLARNFFLFKGSKNYAFASDNTYLDGDAILNKAEDIINFVDDNTAWTKQRQKKNTVLYKRASYINLEGKERGSMAQIQGITTKGDPEKGRGKRGKLLAHEEGGIYPKLLETWNIARPSIEDGKYTFGYQIVFGTGGTPGAKFEGIEELFYRGKGYRVLMLPNVWDKIKGQGSCGYFVPEYMNRKGCYDSNGNSNVVKAMLELLPERLVIKQEASKANALTQEKAERPVTPQEAVMRLEGSLFPVDDLKQYQEMILPEINKFTSKHLVGKLHINPANGEVEYMPSADLKVIREFPLKDNVNKYGAIELFELPKRNGEGKIPRFRYYAGIDTYDDDSSTTNSLGSIFIADIVTDRVVAEYTGRPKTANEFYEICLRLLKYYNAVANYENDKKGLFAYFSHRHMLSYLADNPQILKDMELVKATGLYGNKAKGTNSGAKVNAWGRRLQADWMLDAAEGEENAKKGLLKLHTLRSIGYIKEAIGWNEDGNFDRVSAMGMLMILRQEYLKYKLQVTEELLGKKIERLSQDTFFELNYKKNGDRLPNFIEKLQNDKLQLVE